MAVPQIFDRKLLRHHRDRAARRFSQHDFLHQAVAERLVERFMDIDATLPMPQILTMGDAGGHIGNLLADNAKSDPRRAIETLVHGDISLPILDKLKQNDKKIGAITSHYVQCDEEQQPFAEQSFAAIFSILSLHWANDLPGALIQYHRALRRNGVFLAACWGENSLAALRESFIQAEWAEYGGVTPRFSPSLDGRDMAQILMRAGFILPVVELETLTITYRSIPSMIHDLRGMAENNALSARGRKPLTRRFLAKLHEFYPISSDDNGHYSINLDLIIMTGWRTV